MSVYRVVSDLGNWEVQWPGGSFICECESQADAERIARALQLLDAQEQDEKQGPNWGLYQALDGTPPRTTRCPIPLCGSDRHEGTSNPFAAPCGAKFDTYEEMARHMRENNETWSDESQS